MDIREVTPESKGHRVVQFPDRPNIWIDRLPLSEFQRRFEAGDEEIRKRVADAVEAAETWVARPDGWYLDTIWDREPRGVLTCACPIHPYRVRYYSFFDWSLEDPWRLICPCCREEGRQYDTYPNPRYPDDGGGCFPSDAVWREDHDEAWSRAHNGIPWEHWDGETHGYVEPTNAYYFKGLCWMNAFRALTGTVLQRLGEAYQFALKLQADGEAAERYARKARALLVTLSRAFLGDPYLAAVLGIPQDAFVARLGTMYEPGTEAGHYPGYRLYTPADHLEGDPKRPLDDSRARWGRRGACFYPGVWNWKASESQHLMLGYSLIAESFDAEACEQGLRDAALRIVTSVEGDRERVDAVGQRLKRGIIEYTLHPYTLVTGADNLSTSTQMPRLQLGRILGDDEIVEKVAVDIGYFLHNFFTGDGMGKEGSASYTSWGISSVMEALHGEKGELDRTAAHFDEALGGINLFQTPVFAHGVGSFLYTGFPNGRPIRWEDCTITAAMPVNQLGQLEALGKGIPDPYRRWLEIEKDESGQLQAQLVTPMPMPSHLLGENRKGVLRSGTGENARALAIDFTERVGHYHMAPLSLVLYAKGRELATDLGYMGASHFMTVDWIKTFTAHNTLAIRAADGDPMDTDNLRGDVRYFKDLPGVKAMDAAERDAVELDKVPGTDRFQRTVAMIDVDEDDAYVVDVFRANGGALHDWTFHSNGHRFEYEGIELADRPDSEETLYDHSGFTFTPTRRTPGRGARWGSERVDRLKVGRSAGAWTATWGDVTEFPNEDGTPEVDAEVFLKLHMLDGDRSDVIAGIGPAQRWLDNRDLGEEMTVVAVRREGGTDLDSFVAVYEPYRLAPYVEEVERLELPGDLETTAVRVVHRRGTDLILSTNTTDEASERRRVQSDGHAVETDGELAVASFDGDGLRSLSVIGGTFAEADGQKVEAVDTVEGLLVGFDDVEKSLIVQSDSGIPEGDALSGEVVTVRHRARVSAYTVRNVESQDGGRYTIRLEGGPHLAIGYLRVTGTEAGRIWVEPPPVLQGKVDHLNVFRVENDRSLTFLEPLGGRSSDEICDEWGCGIRSRNALELSEAGRVSPGGDVAISALHPGVDRIRIVGSGHWARQ